MFPHTHHTIAHSTDTKRGMDTSEVELGVVSSGTDPDVVTSGDTIYHGINFSALKRELTLQKVFRERTWKMILRHFVTALIFGALGSFIDIGTDGFTAKSFIRGTNYTKWVKNLSDAANHGDCVHTGRLTSFNPGPQIEYEEIVCFEQDPIWGWFTVGFIFLPAVAFANQVAKIILDVQGKKSYLRHLLLSLSLLFPCLIIFPVVLISVKVVCLINPGPEWKHLNARMTALESSWESFFQATLTLFIIFTRADRQPSTVQIASLVASIVMVTKAAIADSLPPKQSLKDELNATATLFPLFFFNVVFKLLSFAITATCLRYRALEVGSLISFGVLGLEALQRKTSCCSKGFKLLPFGNYTLASLRPEADKKATKRQNTESCVCWEIVWGISYLIVLTSLVAVANINSESLNFTITDNFLNIHTILRFLNIHNNFKRPGLVDNLPLLNGLYAGILAAVALNAGLFYLQIWKPMVEEEERESEEGTESPRI